jgi:hypothetical protein
VELRAWSRALSRGDLTVDLRFPWVCDSVEAARAEVLPVRLHRHWATQRHIHDNPTQDNPTQGDTYVRLRKLVVTASALVLPLTLVAVLNVSAGVASAKGSPINQPGTVKCTKVTGTISFSPPLTLTGNSTENASVDITVKGCTVSGGTVKPKKGVVKEPLATGTNNCSSLQNSMAETLTITWSPASKINPTTASFSGYAVASNSQNDEGFSLPNSGGTGSAVGSYAEASGVTAQAFSNESSSTLASQCGTGLSKLKIVSGTIN